MGLMHIIRGRGDGGVGQYDVIPDWVAKGGLAGVAGSASPHFLGEGEGGWPT